MTVDVSLCGSIPRSEMRSTSCQLPVEESTSETDQIISMAASSLTRKVSEDNMIFSSKRIDIPSWAVSAKGESFLEVSFRLNACFRNPLGSFCFVFLT